MSFKTPSISMIIFLLFVLACGNQDQLLKINDGNLENKSEAVVKPPTNVRNTEDLSNEGLNTDEVSKAIDKKADENKEKETMQKLEIARLEAEEKIRLADAARLEAEEKASLAKAIRLAAEEETRKAEIDLLEAEAARLEAEERTRLAEAERLEAEERTRLAEAARLEAEEKARLIEENPKSQEVAMEPSPMLGLDEIQLKIPSYSLPNIPIGHAIEIVLSCSSGEALYTNIYALSLITNPNKPKELSISFSDRVSSMRANNGDFCTATISNIVTDEKLFIGETGSLIDNGSLELTWIYIGN